MINYFIYFTDIISSTGNEIVFIMGSDFFNFAPLEEILTLLQK